MRPAYLPATPPAADWREPSGVREHGPEAALRPPPLPSADECEYESATFRIRPRFLVGENMSAAILSGVAGFVDVAGFVALFGLLPAHLTGQLVAAASTITDGNHVGVIRGVALVPLFVVAVATAAVISRLARRRGIPPLTSLLGLMAVALSMFSCVGMVLKNYAVAPEHWATFVIGGSAVMAMGVQNALMREALGKYCPTTMMTGNLTQLIILLVEPAVSDGGAAHSVRPPASQRLKKVGSPLLGFSVGAALGAWLTSLFGLISIALPTVVIGTLCAITWRQHRTPV